MLLLTELFTESCFFTFHRHSVNHVFLFTNLFSRFLHQHKNNLIYLAEVFTSTEELNISCLLICCQPDLNAALCEDARRPDDGPTHLDQQADPGDFSYFYIFMNFMKYFLNFFSRICSDNNSMCVFPVYQYMMVRGGCWLQ